MLRYHENRKSDSDEYEFIACAVRRHFDKFTIELTPRAHVHARAPPPTDWRAKIGAPDTGKFNKGKYAFSDDVKRQEDHVRRLLSAVLYRTPARTYGLTDIRVFYITLSRGKRACEPLESMWSPPPIETRKPRRGTGALPAFWVGIRYLMSGRVG
ncbi:hypothetical protein EVAR_21592_1 [Eumeta japonica]|uniref:Uncharacterized protein n=1 Tax=Eumeta variegata TaxID=151549 RepID=A0A4C1UZC4_EUMVA|nr:hypothetical protein EVAR_21592_1 [Eumeta japonica]